MSCLCETEGGRVPASSVCRGGALEPCRCPGTCRLSPGVHECTCVDGSVGRQSCFDGAETACSCEPDSVRCRVGDSLACRCADGSVGAQLCETFDSRPEGILGPCECRGGGGPLDASVGDDGGPVATDAAWPDGCSPISCAERGCGTHTASCGIVVDCGPCEAVRRTLELEARDLLWDASRGVLYVSVPSSEPRGNTVGAVDPLTLERTFDGIRCTTTVLA